MPNLCDSTWQASWVLPLRTVPRIPWDSEPGLSRADEGAPFLLLNLFSFSSYSLSSGDLTQAHGLKYHF